MWHRHFYNLYNHFWSSAFLSSFTNLRPFPAEITVPANVFPWCSFLIPLWNCSYVNVSWILQSCYSNYVKVVDTVIKSWKGQTFCLKAWSRFDTYLLIREWTPLHWDKLFRHTPYNKFIVIQGILYAYWV